MKNCVELEPGTQSCCLQHRYFFVDNTNNEGKTADLGSEKKGLETMPDAELKTGENISNRFG